MHWASFKPKIHHGRFLHAINIMLIFTVGPLEQPVRGGPPLRRAPAAGAAKVQGGRLSRVGRPGQAAPAEQALLHHLRRPAAPPAHLAPGGPAALRRPGRGPLLLRGRLPLRPRRRGRRRPGRDHQGAWGGSRWGPGGRHSGRAGWGVRPGGQGQAGRRQGWKGGGGGSSNWRRYCSYIGQ